MKFTISSEGSMSLLAAPPGLELIPDVSPMVPKRSWAEVVKSQRYETNMERTSQKRVEQASQSDSDEETQANSSSLESDISDSESSISDSPSLNPEPVTLKHGVNDAIQSEQQSGFEMCRPTLACTDDEACTRLRRNARPFVPMGTATMMTTIAPPPGLHTILRSQANAFVPGAW
jgi:hypothetical protein